MEHVLLNMTCPAGAPVTTKLKLKAGRIHKGTVGKTKDGWKELLPHKLEEVNEQKLTVVVLYLSGAGFDLSSLDLTNEEKEQIELTARLNELDRMALLMTEDSHSFSFKDTEGHSCTIKRVPNNIPGEMEWIWVAAWEATV